MFFKRTSIHYVNRIYLHCNPTNRKSALEGTLVTFVRDFLRPVTEHEYENASNANLDHVVLLVTSFDEAEPYLVEFRKLQHVPVTRNLILANAKKPQMWQWIQDDDESHIVLDMDGAIEAGASNARKLQRLPAASYPVQVSLNFGRLENEDTDLLSVKGVP